MKEEKKKMSIWKQMVQMDFFCFLASLLSEIDWQQFFSWERFRWTFSPDGSCQMEKLFCFASGGHSGPASCVLALFPHQHLFLHLYPPITASPTRRKTSCPACRSLFLKPERSSSRLRCRSMTAARLVWASASKETSPGRRGRTWGSSSSPLSTEGLRTRWPNALSNSQMSKDEHRKVIGQRNTGFNRCSLPPVLEPDPVCTGRQQQVEAVECIQGRDLLGASTKSARVCSCLMWSKGRTFVHQRPAGCGKRRVAAGKLQPPGHGDAPPLHVAGGERPRNHPAGCSQGCEGTHQRGAWNYPKVNWKSKPLQHMYLSKCYS